MSEAAEREANAWRVLLRVQEFIRKHQHILYTEHARETVEIQHEIAQVINGGPPRHIYLDDTETMRYALEAAERFVKDSLVASWVENWYHVVIWLCDYLRSKGEIFDYCPRCGHTLSLGTPKLCRNCGYERTKDDSTTTEATGNTADSGDGHSNSDDGLPNPPSRGT